MSAEFRESFRDGGVWGGSGCLGRQHLILPFTVRTGDVWAQFEPWLTISTLQREALSRLSRRTSLEPFEPGLSHF